MITNYLQNNMLKLRMIVLYQFTRWVGILSYHMKGMIVDVIHIYYSMAQRIHEVANLNWLILETKKDPWKCMQLFPTILWWLLVLVLAMHNNLQMKEWMHSLFLNQRKINKKLKIEQFIIWNCRSSCVQYFLLLNDKILVLRLKFMIETKFINFFLFYINFSVFSEITVHRYVETETIMQHV